MALMTHEELIAEARRWLSDDRRDEYGPPDDLVARLIDALKDCSDPDWGKYERFEQEMRR